MCTLGLLPVAGHCSIDTTSVAGLVHRCNVRASLRQVPADTRGVCVSLSTAQGTVDAI